MLSTLYRTVTTLGAPLIGLYLHKRRAAGREDTKRYRERFGYASKLRPDGRVIWCHAASVGEASSLLALIVKMRALYPRDKILVTTGTVTSAAMLAKRLPPGAVHQYAPVDVPACVRRFLSHWQPDCALWIESELWPNTLRELRERLIPAALLNGRLSDKSFRTWQRARGWAKEILDSFALILAQTEDDRARFTALGAADARCLGNLKYAADPLPVNEMELARLRGMIGERPLWLVASSHPGEEEIALAAHRKLREGWPEILTIIVPRHATRGNSLAELIRGKNISFARRSHKQPITRQTEIYLADTMGELGLFYRLAPLAAMGGSFNGHGGHNPIEAAQLGCALLLGPDMHNFATMAGEFSQARAAVAVKNAGEIAFAVDRLLTDANERARLTDAAKKLADEKRGVLSLVLQALEPWLKHT